MNHLPAFVSILKDYLTEYRVHFYGKFIFYQWYIVDCWEAGSFSFVLGKIVSQPLINPVNRGHSGNIKQILCVCVWEIYNTLKNINIFGFISEYFSLFICRCFPACYLGGLSHCGVSTVCWIWIQKQQKQCSNHLQWYGIKRVFNIFFLILNAFFSSNSFIMAGLHFISLEHRNSTPQYKFQALFRLVQARWGH